ncbi:MAG: alpha/beta hydrolase family esterase [Pikeienuella sp.]
MFYRLLFLLSALSLAAGAAKACGGPDDACETPLGSYFAVKPEATEGHRPAVIFFHGGGGWGSRIFTMRKEMADAFTKRGYVVIAPNGKKRPGSKFGPGWSFIPQFPPIRDEVAFTREIIADAADKFSIDASRVVITGYSIGGSLTSYLACRDPSVGVAFAPLAGGFWKPHPETCTGSVRLLHTHGWRDQTVPLEGRPLGAIGVEQGDIYETIAMWREKNGCAKYRADEFVTDGPFWRRKWTHCDTGALEFALHPGGHNVPPEWANMVLNWFEGLPAE